MIHSVSTISSKHFVLIRLQVNFWETKNNKIETLQILTVFGNIHINLHLQMETTNEPELCTNRVAERKRERGIVNDMLIPMTKIACM